MSVRAPANRDTNPWVVLVVLALGTFVTLLDLTIINIAIPSVIDGVHASFDQVLWMLNGYSLAYAVLLITSGRLGDIVGPRRLFVVGLLLFTAASAFSGLAQTPEQLIAGRALQGIGAALLAPQTMAIMLSLFPADRRGPVFAVYGILAGLAVVVGPTLGGFLVTNFGWRWIFFVNLPVGVGVIVAALKLVPNVKPGRRHRLDIVGVALVTAGLLCLVFGLIEGQRYDWGTVSGVLSIPLILGVGAVLMAAFIVHQARRQGREPLVPFAVFRDRNFTLMALVLSAMGFAIIGLYVPLTIYYQSVLALSAVAAGLTVAVQPVSMFFTSGAANSPAAQRRNPKYLLIPGLLALAAGSAYIAFAAHADSSRWSLLPGLIVSGLGMGCIWGPVFTVATHDLRPELAGVASGVINTIQELGAVIASATVGALMQNRLAVALHDRAVEASAQLPPAYAGQFVSGFSHAARGGFEVGAGQTGGSFAPPPGLAAGAVQQLQSLAHSVFANSFVDAMRPTLLLPIAVIALAALATFWIRDIRRREAGVQAPDSDVVSAA